MAKNRVRRGPDMHVGAHALAFFSSNAFNVGGGRVR
jgi:hypothetical protein